MKVQKWKSVSLPLSTCQSELEGLINIEELSDYDDTEITRAPTASSFIPSEKRKRLVNSETDEELDDSCSLPESSHLTTKSKRKKRRNKQKKPPKEEFAITEQSEESAFSDAKFSSPISDAWMPYNLPSPVLKAIIEKQFVTPTEIQSLCLPDAMLKRKDVFGAAETGSGKTLAFGIPVVCGILEQLEREKETDSTETEKQKKLYALIVAPTRELAIQVKNHIKDICKYTSISVQEVVGGLSVEKQNRLLNKHPHIVVGTPGRLWQMIRSDNEFLSSSVDGIRYLVIDEADRMVEKLHYPELLCLLERLNYKRSGFRQTFVFSATLTLVHEPPDYIVNKLKKKKKPMRITPGEKLRSFIALVGAKNPSIIDITKEAVVTSGLKEIQLQCSMDEKDQYLYYIVKKHLGRKIVFCNGVNAVKRLNDLFKLLQIPATCLYANMVQKQRLRNLERFRNDQNGILLATDVAARGLDITDVQYIIHYHVPKTCELYVHRSGRSARGSHEGTSILLCCPAEVQNYSKILRTLGKGQFTVYEVESFHLLNALKQRISLARKIFELKNKVQRVNSNSNWVEKCAREMDIELDEDERPPKLDNEDQKVCKRQLNSMMEQLKKLVQKPILPDYISPRYPSLDSRLLPSNKAPK